MEVASSPARSFLRRQSRGLRASPPYPFTHSLSPYTGCAFGNTACGSYCYAQFLPNWIHGSEGAAWGSAVRVKENAAELLAAELARLGPARRSRARVFMASTTDPYQPIEARHQITRRCLEVFARHDDLDLLLVQTRGPLAKRDFDLLARIPYAWLSVTVETDDQGLLRRLGGGPPASKRLALVETAGRHGIKAQVAASPCLAYPPDLPARLLAVGARRF